MDGYQSKWSQNCPFDSYVSKMFVVGRTRRQTSWVLDDDNKIHAWLVLGEGTMSFYASHTSTYGFQDELCWLEESSYNEKADWNWPVRLNSSCAVGTAASQWRHCSSLTDQGQVRVGEGDTGPGKNSFISFKDFNLDDMDLREIPAQFLWLLDLDDNRIEKWGYLSSAQTMVHGQATGTSSEGMIRSCDHYQLATFSFLWGRFRRLGRTITVLHWLEPKSGQTLM